MSGLEQTVFSNVGSLTSLNLENNPLHCDCRLSWLATWLTASQNGNLASQHRNLASSQHGNLATRQLASQASNPNNQMRLSQRPVCSTPALLSGRTLIDVSPRTMVCTGNPRDPIQERCDPCFSSPCQHGGLCLKGSSPSTRQGERFTCQCPSMFTGPRCEARRDPCLDSPCRNGGQCRSRRGEVFCSCSPGWEGARCEINTNECASHVCQNGGLCRDRTAGYSCDCVGGWLPLFPCLAILVLAWRR